MRATNSGTEACLPTGLYSLDTQTEAPAGKGLIKVTQLVREKERTLLEDQMLGWGALV